MRIAENKPWTLAETMQKIGAREFLLWKAKYEQDVNGFHREDYYWAQIALELVRGRIKDPRKVNLKQFLLQFTHEESPQKVLESIRESIEDEIENELSEEKEQFLKNKVQDSKNFWLALVGVGKDGKVKKRALPDHPKNKPKKKIKSKDKKEKK